MQIKRWPNPGDKIGVPPRVVSDLARPLSVHHLRPLSMSALGTPVQDDLQPQPQDHQLQVQQQQLTADLQSQQLHNGDPPSSVQESGRKRESPNSTAQCLQLSPDMLAKAPSVRRACAACHAGKTRCSEVLPCQASVILLFST